MLRVHPVVVRVAVLAVLVMMQGSSGGGLALEGGLAEPEQCVFRRSGSCVHLVGERVGVRCGSNGGICRCDRRLKLGLRLQPESVLVLAEVLHAIGWMLCREVRLESHWLLRLLLLVAAAAVLVVMGLVVVVLVCNRGWEKGTGDLCVGVFGWGIWGRQNGRDARCIASLLQQGHSGEGDGTEIWRRKYRVS